MTEGTEGRQRSEPRLGSALLEGSCCTGVERDHGWEKSSASLPGPLPGMLTVVQGSGGRHTPTQLQKKLMKGRLQVARGGDRASRDPSSAVTEDTRSKFLKAHHKLSSIWEPVFLAGPTQRLQTRVKQR